MSVTFNEHFTQQFRKAPQTVQRAFGKQLGLLLSNLRHPSLNAKVVDINRRQARVNGGWRFYFQIEGTAYKMLEIRKHP